MNNATAAEALQKLLDSFGESLDGFVLVSFRQGQATVTPHLVSPGDIALAQFLVGEDLRRRMQPEREQSRIQAVRAIPRLS